MTLAKTHPAPVHTPAAPTADRPAAAAENPEITDVSSSSPGRETGATAATTPGGKHHRPPRLGRGLSSLMAHPVQIVVPRQAPLSTPSSPSSASQTPAPPAPAPTPMAADAHDLQAGPTPRSDGLSSIPIAAIVANPHQPRQKFDPAALERLAESIKSAGVMQPIIVRPTPVSGLKPLSSLRGRERMSPSAATGEGGATGASRTASSADRAQSSTSYELVAGERRWRAAELAGLTHIPAIIRVLDDRQVAEWALIENLQREDLNPIERAQAFQNLITLFKLGQDQVAQRVGIDRSSVANSLRLLSLHQDVQQLVRENLLSLGQARAIAAVTDTAQQVALATKAVRAGWSVRQVEAAVRGLVSPAPGVTPGATPGDDLGAAPGVGKLPGRAAHLTDLEQQITQQLGTKVHLRSGRKKGSGSMTIEFYSLDQFDALLARLGVRMD
jgi:ParB family transcriptional regulator, chromosome partitioning protein